MVDVRDDGRFQIHTNRHGIVTYWFMGSNHTTTRVWVTTEKGDTVRLNVQLPTADYLNPIEDVQLIDYSESSPLYYPMSWSSREEVWRVKVPVRGDTLFYQLGNVAAGALETDERTYNGTQSDGFVYDGGGDFISYLVAESDSIDVTFDPAALPPEKLPVKASFDCSDCLAEKVRVFLSDMDRYHKIRDSTKWQIADSLERSSSRQTASVDAALDAYMVFTIGRKSIDSAIARRIIREIPPSSILWSLNTDWIYRIANSAKLSEADLQRYVEAAIDGLPDSNAVAMLLFTQIDRARSKGDEFKAQEYLGRLLTDHGNSRVAYRASILFGDSGLKVGSSAPGFEFISLDESPLSSDELRGSVVLLHFWGTWCGPCRKSLPKLRDLFKEFGADGLRIVSAAVADRKSAVESFISTNGMTWDIGLVEGGFDAATLKSYGVLGVPWTVLIDQEGRVRSVNATEEELTEAIRGLLDDG